MRQRCAWSLLLVDSPDTRSLSALVIPYLELKLTESTHKYKYIKTNAFFSTEE